MNALLNTVYQSPAWFFICFGCLLLIIELLGTAYYVFWCGLAAFLVAFIAYFNLISWPYLWLLFALFSLVSVYFWYQWQKHSSAKDNQTEQLNQPKNELIGIKTVVTVAIINSSGRVKINDGSWPATAKEDIAQGTFVEVIDNDGYKLTVIPIIN